MKQEKKIKLMVFYLIKMMEITESKYGFVPGANEPGASRVRKKFRFSKGGHPSVWLVHYTRGPTCGKLFFIFIFYFIFGVLPWHPRTNMVM